MFNVWGKIAGYSILLVAMFGILLANAFGMRAMIQNARAFDRIPIVHTFLTVSGFGKRSVYPGKTYLNLSSIKQRMTVQARGAVIEIPDVDTSVQLVIDTLSLKKGARGRIIGWVVPNDPSAYIAFLAVVSGQETIAVGDIDKFRPDVAAALGRPNARWSGFSIELPAVEGSSVCDTKLLLVFASLVMSSHELRPAGCH